VSSSFCGLLRKYLYPFSSEREFVITSQSQHNKHDDDALSFYTHKRPAKVIAQLLLLHA